MPVQEIEPRELAEKLKGPKESRPVLVDVRTHPEHEIVALPDSLLWPLQELQLHADDAEALKGKEVVVYCHHGVRSLSGAAFLDSLGVPAKSLSGGIERYAVEVDPKLPRY